MKRVVKPMVNGRALAFLAILCAAMALLVLWIAYGLMTGDLGLPRLGWGLYSDLLLASAVLLVLMSIASAWGAWFWLRLERRRQKAARGIGADIFLATEQPPPRTAPLSLPLTISIRAKGGLKLIAWLSVAVFVIAVSGGEAVDHGVWDFRFFLVLLAAVGSGSVFVQLLAGERRIEVTDDQVTIRVASIEQTVPWEEARLFAITHGRHATLSYELSSSEACVPWIWVRPSTFSARLYEPTIPQYEYDRQMEGLLALVAAKTGLPLYDLR